MLRHLSRKAPTGLVAVVILMLCGTLTAVRGQTTLGARLAARPLTRPEITSYKLPATTQVAAGLTTVALGEPAYLEVQFNSSYAATDVNPVIWELSQKPYTSRAVLTDSPLGSDVPVYEPADRLVYQVAGRTLLRPDIAGIYVVTARVTTVKGESVTLGQTVVGATYVGISTCALCHSGGMARNMTQSWAKTTHSILFKDGVNGVASDHYTSSCIGCHTVGYDTSATASNNGFSDLMAKLKWTFPTAAKAGVWDTVPTALQNVANIQCENCHGPGSLHATSGGTAYAISVTYGSGDCGQCHDAPTHHIKTAEWNNSRHAITTRDPSGAGRGTCVGCHTGPGFVGKLQPAATVDTTYAPITCQACHEPHGQTAPDGTAHMVRTVAAVTLADGTKVTDGGAGLLCMNCHKSRQNAATYAAKTAGSSHFGPHSGPQADMLEGVNGFTFGQTIPSSAHWFVVSDSCVTCHMQTLAETDPGFSQVGGHTFKASLAAGAKTPAIDLVAACQQCHGPDLKTFDFALMDYNGDGKIEGAQTEVQHLLDQLSALLPPAGQAKSALNIDSTWTQPQLEAAYNWLMVNNDGSKGIHNMAYSVGLLKASITFLENQQK